MVKDVTPILQGEQPAMGRSTSPVHDGVGPGLDGSILPFITILVLVVWFGLPLTDVVGPDDALHLVGDVILDCITDKLVHSTASTELSSKVLTNCLPDHKG